MKHAELIARLEAAEVGLRELDWAVCGAVNIWRTDGIYKAMAPWTQSIDSALALAVRLVGERAALSMLFIVAGCCDSIRKLPLGLCIAVLRALDAQEGA